MTAQTMTATAPALFAGIALYAGKLHTTTPTPDRARAAADLAAWRVGRTDVERVYVARVYEVDRNGEAAAFSTSR